MVTIVNLIPVGHENAISRERLAEMALKTGLITDTCKDVDRQTRKLISRARRENVILSSDDGGYFRPCRYDGKDMELLRHYIAKERSRALKTLTAIKYANRYYQDIIHDRL